jgi:nucleoside recognition membrane protein YjiH
LGDSIQEAINTLLLIGGFIIFFSVLTQILNDIGFTSLLTSLISIILKPLGFEKTVILPLIGGLFELTNGSDLASQANAPLIQQLIITSGIIAWSGLSVHAQVMTMINDTDLRIKPYLWARVLHGISASIITYLLLKPGTMLSNYLLQPVAFKAEQLNLKINYLDYISQITLSIFLILAAAIFISLAIYFIKKIKIISFHYFS